MALIMNITSEHGVPCPAAYLKIMEPGNYDTIRKAGQLPIDIWYNKASRGGGENNDPVLTCIGIIRLMIGPTEISRNGVVEQLAYDDVKDKGRADLYPLLKTKVVQLVRGGSLDLSTAADDD